MKKNSQKDFLVYIAAKSVAALTRIFPYYWALFLGKFLGLATYYLSRRKKKTAYANLRAAFRFKFSSEQIKAINRRMFIHLGMTIMEILSIPKFNRKNIDNYIKFNGLDKIDRALAAKRGVIILTAHFGNWELASIALAIKGYPMLVLAKEQKMPRLNQLLNIYRQMQGCRVVSLGMAVREIIKALKENKIVGMLGDQGADKDSVMVDFMGRDVPVPQGVVAFAQKTNAVVFPAFITRKGFRHEINIEDSLEIFSCGDIEEDTKQTLEQFNVLLEKYVREQPEQWVWVYKRWKYSSQKNVLVLSDGKPGHLRQSLAVVELLKTNKHWEVNLEVIEVKYRHFITRLLTNACVLFSSRNCQGCLSCLKYGLDNDSFDKLNHSYADIVVSAGASLAAINRIISIENNARSIVLMKPSFLPYNLFDLAILPRHDQPPVKRNIVVTEGALSFFSEEKSRPVMEGFRRELNLTKQNVISVLVGGDTPEFMILPQQIEQVLTQVKAAAEEADAEVLVTTSRRTSIAVEEAIVRQMRDFKQCKLLAIPRLNNDPGVMPRILALSRVIVVSGESISMVSEAASCGAAVVVFRPVKLSGGLCKHEYFLGNMERNGFAVIAAIEEIKQAILDFLAGKRQPRVLNDAGKVKAALDKVI